MLNCKYCGSNKVQFRGPRKGAFGITYHRYQCRSCGKWDKEKVSGSYPRTPKVLLFDIECLPMEVYVWGLSHNDYISPSNIIRDWCVISWAAKWLYSSEVHSNVLTPEEAFNRDDRRILEPMWKLLDEADVVITHNGNKFDLKKLNTRFLIHGFPPPHSYQSIDTLAVAKKHFAFSSNKLDYINHQLGLPPKKENSGMSMWMRCSSGDVEALQEMEGYNIVDVTSMEETYLTLRPWISNHPNLALLANMDGKACPVCQGTHLKVEGLYSTHVAQYAEYRCQDCGAIGRGKRNVAPKQSERVKPISNPYPRSIPKVLPSPTG